MSRDPKRGHTVRRLLLSGEERNEVIRWLECQRKVFAKAAGVARQAIRQTGAKYLEKQLQYNNNAAGAVAFLIAQILQSGESRQQKEMETDNASH